MTLEDFNNLTPIEQEEFLSDGGTISQTAPVSEKEVILPISRGVEASEETETVGATENVIRPHSSVESSETVTMNQQSPPPSSETSQWADGFDIVDPLELLYLLDDDVRDGKVILHDWQVRFLTDFAKGGTDDQHPFQSIVRAANGSGKDKYIIAPCVVWLCMRYKLARGVVTSSSGVQLDNQTDAYIHLLCTNANRKWANGKETIWKCNYRYYECLPTESPILCFATDEPGKAEGFHPLGYARKMGLFESEAKSVPDDIYLAQNKCTGYTHRCIVSTPGLPMGHFFDLDSTAVDRNSVKEVTDVQSGDYVKYHIIAHDCSHISKAYIEQMKRDLPGGELGAAYKSQVMAEFGTTDEMVVIPYTYVWKAFTSPPPWVPEPYNKAGLDLSDGGAETVLLIRNGNKHLKTIPFRFDNTEDTLDFLEEKFKENDLTHHDAKVFTDVCGIGKPMAQALRRRGWSNIFFVDSRNASSHPKVYSNRGTELFFHARTLLERHELIVQRGDALLVRQLSTRYYKMNTKMVHQLLTKLEQRSRGYPSPDRADAFNLAFWDYKSTYIEKVPANDSERPVQGGVNKPKYVGTFTQQTLTNRHETPKSRLGKKPDFSLYQEQIDEYNRRLKLDTITVE